MSHDRGCPCGRERYDYEDCPNPNCARAEIVKRWRSEPVFKPVLDALVGDTRHCQCDQPVIRCDNRGCRCSRCGLPEGLKIMITDKTEEWDMGERRISPTLNPNNHQEGGEHYKSGYQHWDVIEEHGLGYIEGCASKYVVRWRKKNGVEDLKKAAHYVQKLINLVESQHRKLRGIVSKGSLVRFLTANTVPPTEAAILELLFTWTVKDDLVAAESWIQQLITQANAEANAD